jgi:hypothetical protein
MSYGSTQYGAGGYKGGAEFAGLLYALLDLLPRGVAFPVDVNLDGNGQFVPITETPGRIVQIQAATPTRPVVRSIPVFTDDQFTATLESLLPSGFAWGAA